VIAIISFIKNLAFDNLSSTVIIFISAGAAFFFIVQITKRIFPVLKRFKWLWYIQIILVLIITFIFNSLFFRIFHTGEESKALIAKAGSTLLWLLGAYFIQQALSLFFWNGSYLKRHNTAPPGLLISLVSGALYLIAVYGILTVVFKQAMTGFLVSSSIVAAVLGLAMQDSLADIIAGIAISIEKPFRIGDWIETADGTRGEVVDVNWRATQLMSSNSSLFIIPNAKISNALIHNYSLPDRFYSYYTYIYVPVAISPVLVRRVLLEACVASEKVLNVPAPVVRVNEAGASFKYMINVHFETYPAHFAGKDDLLLNIWIKCAHHGITPSSEANEVVVRKGTTPKVSGLSPEELLSQTALFGGLSSEDRQNLIGQMHVQTAAAGTVIFEQGSTGSSLYIIATGMVRIEITFSNKTKNVVSTLGAGDYFGEMSLLANVARSATVIAHTECQLLELRRSALRPIFAQNPELIKSIARSVTERRMYNQQMADNLTEEDFAGKLNALAAKLVSRMSRIFIKG